MFHLFTLLVSAAILIPRPVSCIHGYGEHTLRADGKDVRVHVGGRSFRKAVAELPAFAQEEAYRLTVGERKVRIEALTETGVFRARKTLEQLALQDSTLQTCIIFDYPRFRHRGLMIDESRSFKGKAFLLKQMDVMALLKLNVLHLHLDDSAGWRLQIDTYPDLTAKTAFRIGRSYFTWEAKGYPFTTEDDPEGYGGYYTKEDIREIVAYAAERHITVIPEIEMPGHSMEVNRAYPDLACRTEDGRPRAFSWDLCPGKEETFRMLEAVLDEVMDLFPSELIHIGGDEAVMKDWPVCVDCRRRMQEEGMTDVHELQGYLVRRIDAFVRSRGRRIIGWDEIVDTGLPADAVVQSWRGAAGGQKAVASGHDVVMSPNTYLYLDYYQDLIRKEPPACGHLQSLHHVYDYDPAGGMPAEGLDHLLGIQGNLWCEYIPTVEHAEYMLYPRAFAIAEIGWTPQEKRSFYLFREQALILTEYLRSRGYHPFDMTGESGLARSGRLSY